MQLLIAPLGGLPRAADGVEIVERKGLAGYFLICWDIVRFARSRGMRSLGRGSAGNSLLSYALGITHVNPLRHNLFFERFPQIVSRLEFELAWDEMDNAYAAITQ